MGELTLQNLALIGGLLALLWPIIFAALAYWLSRIFPSQKEFDGLGERVTAVLKVAEVANEQAGMAMRTAEAAARDSAELQRVFDERFVRMIQTQEVVTISLQKTADTLQKVQIAQERNTTLTSGVVKDIERLFELVEKLFDRIEQRGEQGIRGVK